MKRRTFLEWVAGLVSALAVGLVAVPGFGYILSPLFKPEENEWVPLGPVPSGAEAEPRGIRFSHPDPAGFGETETQGLVFVSGEGEGMTVFSSRCTHLGCTVRWNRKREEFTCPCHGGRYDREGRVTAGPPPRPLDELPWKVEEGTLWIALG